jgi:[methyl-Co(III) methanol-specific corrinoid protein]:coenzyme M methyltransferase
MTVEAECCGAKVDLGSATSQPRVRGSVLAADGAGDLHEPDFTSGRAGTLLAALKRAKAGKPDLALIGNLVGPFSLLGMLADPLMLLRWTRRKPDLAHRHLDRLTDALIRVGTLQAEAGCDAVCIADPTATGEILGDSLFRSFALPYLNRITGQLRRAGTRAIVHICGNARAIEKELFELDADAVSFDSSVDIVAIAEKKPRWRTMGNVDTFLLDKGPAGAVRRSSRRLLDGGVKLLAPACGVIPTTPVSHLRAMREAART